MTIKTTGGMIQFHLPKFTCPCCLRQGLSHTDIGLRVDGTILACTACTQGAFAVLVESYCQATFGRSLTFEYPDTPQDPDAGAGESPQDLG